MQKKRPVLSSTTAAGEYIRPNYSSYTLVDVPGLQRRFASVAHWSVSLFLSCRFLLTFAAISRFDLLTSDAQFCRRA